MEPKFISSNVDSRLAAISSDLDLSEAPPIHQKRLVTFYNNFVVTMVDFLNNFNNSCSHRLFMFDRKISKIEAELRLLEIKLKSINGFENVSPVAGKDEADGPPTEDVAKEEAREEMSEQTAVDQKQVTPEEPDPQLEDNPALMKYIRMVRVGVPIDGVKQKMAVEGLDPELLKM